MTIAVTIAGRENGMWRRRGLTGAALVTYAASGLCLGGTAFGATKYLLHILGKFTRISGG